MFPVALPDCKSDHVAFAFNQTDVHVHMPNVLRKSSSRPSDHNNSRLHGDCHPIWNLQFFSFEDIAHLQEDRQVLAIVPSRYPVTVDASIG
jgi:hypothetical protein